MTVDGTARVEINDGQSPDDIDWDNEVFDGDDLVGKTISEFMPEGRVRIEVKMEMNDYKTYVEEEFA